MRCFYAVRNVIALMASGSVSTYACKKECRLLTDRDLMQITIIHTNIVSNATLPTCCQNCTQSSCDKAINMQSSMH